MLRSIGALQTAPSLDKGYVEVAKPPDKKEVSNVEQVGKEPDSGISSARSTGTVPWSNQEVALPALKVPAIRDTAEGVSEEHQL